MSYSYKTENLGLPIWGSNDKPTQDDLNYQNYQIDKQFKTGLNQYLANLTNKEGDFLSLRVNYEPINNSNIYFLNMKDQYDKSNVININCGTIIDVYYGPYSTYIHFIPYDWFNGDINDIIVQCIMKEGE